MFPKEQGIQLPSPEVGNIQFQLLEIHPGQFIGGVDVDNEMPAYINEGIKGPFDII